MALKKITGSVDRIKEILERWENIPEISDIERELVLDKLKQIYEDVMFFEREPYVDEAMEKFDDQEPEAKSVAADQILFEDEIAITSRQPVDRDTILSLYGNDPNLTHMKTRPSPQVQKTEPTPCQEQPNAPQSHTAPQPQSAPQPLKIQESEKTEEEFDLELSRRGIHTPTAETAAPAAPKKVFEEIIDNGNDLRHSIGLNDKALLIKELFDGDSIKYEEVITTLDKFTDLDDALIHIQETYSWNPDCEGIKLLVDHIERKLG